MHRSFSLLCALILAVGCGNVLGRSLALREVDANGFNRAIKANSVVFVFAYARNAMLCLRKQGFQHHAIKHVNKHESLRLKRDSNY